MVDIIYGIKFEKMHILINVPCGKDTLKNDIHY